MSATWNNEPDYRTTNLKDITMYDLSELQSYLPPREQFPLTMDMEIDADLNLETELELPLLPSNTDLAHFDCDWVERFIGTESVPDPLNRSFDSTSTERYSIDNSFGSLNDRIQRAGSFQLHTNLESGNSSAMSALASDNDLFLKSSLSTQGHHQPLAPSPNADMLETSLRAPLSLSSGVYICEICANSFDKRFHLK